MKCMCMCMHMSPCYCCARVCREEKCFSSDIPPKLASPRSRSSPTSHTLCVLSELPCVCSSDLSLVGV